MNKITFCSCNSYDDDNYVIFRALSDVISDSEHHCLFDSQFDSLKEKLKKSTFIILSSLLDVEILFYKIGWINGMNNKCLVVTSKESEDYSNKIKLLRKHANQFGYTSLHTTGKIDTYDKLKLIIPYLLSEDYEGLWYVLAKYILLDFCRFYEVNQNHITWREFNSNLVKESNPLDHSPAVLKQIILLSLLKEYSSSINTYILSNESFINMSRVENEVLKIKGQITIVSEQQIEIINEFRFFPISYELISKNSSEINLISNKIDLLENKLVGEILSEVTTLVKESTENLKDNSLKKLNEISSEWKVVSQQIKLTPDVKAKLKLSIPFFLFFKFEKELAWDGKDWFKAVREDIKRGRKGNWSEMFVE